MAFPCRRQFVERGEGTGALHNLTDPLSSGERFASWSAVVLYRFAAEGEIPRGDSTGTRCGATRGEKAPEDWRTPKPGGPLRLGKRYASSSAVALSRHCLEKPVEPLPTR
jgi:hypothetical protein